LEGLIKILNSLSFERYITPTKVQSASLRTVLLVWFRKVCAKVQYDSSYITKYGEMSFDTWLFVMDAAVDWADVDETN